MLGFVMDLDQAKKDKGKKPEKPRTFPYSVVPQIPGPSNREKRVDFTSEPSDTSRYMLGSYNAGGGGGEPPDSSSSASEKEPRKGKGKKGTNKSDSKEDSEEESQARKDRGKSPNQTE